MFVDYAKVEIRSGNGGRGCLSFRREKYKPRGGPDGGDGGDGGDVIFVGDERLNNLVSFRYSPKLFAGNGQHGRGNNRSGKKGETRTVRVPCGTIVRDAATGAVLCEITEPSVPVTIARGGKGGRGNQHFATAVNQAPRHVQAGRAGEYFRAELELKIMADVGLIGLPNAGKSSLIAAVSAATPKIAEYPFTTLDPAVGVIELSDFRTIVVADIPGIIEGASHGKGLGTRFLKHVERTTLLLYVIDVSAFADVSPGEAYTTIRRELQEFGNGLDLKGYIIAASKVDLDHDGTAVSAFMQSLNDGVRNKVVPISSATRSGIDDLIAALDNLLRRNANTEV